MVAWCESRLDRLARAVESAQLPGESGDHQEVAAWMKQLADHLDPDGDDVLLEQLIQHAHLQALGAVVTETPDERVADLRELIGCGACSPELWLMIRNRILRYRGTPLGRSPRWEVDGRLLAPLVQGLYEMGERQLWSRLAEILKPLVRGRDGDVEIRIRDADPETSRRWSRGLRQQLKEEGLPCRWEPLILSV